MTSVDIVRHADPDSLAEAVAARLITTVVARQADAGAASVCLTGGRIGTAVLQAVNASSARSAVDWSRIDIWWGDERYLPEGDPERNETSARRALLDHVPVPADRVHPMAGPWASSSDAESAAAQYAEELARHALPEDHAGVPTIDIMLLSIGPDGHIASLFPEQPALHDDRAVVAVHGSPKPPPTRVTLTLATICAAREVWLLGAGAEKAEAVSMALSGAGVLQIPASGAQGRERTLWLLDEQAAANLSPEIGRPAG